MNRVIYATHSGNTRKLAQAIADELDIKIDPVERIKVMAPVDTLFLGTSIYAGTINAKIGLFLKKLEPNQVKRIVVFGTSGKGESIVQFIRNVVSEKGIEVSEAEFNCKGSFLYFINRGRPNKEDLENVKKFAREVNG